MALPQGKVALYSVTDLKNTSDDAIPAYLNSLKFRQSHTLSDIRLVLGYTLILISAITFVWDYKFGFESTKVYTAVAIFIYTLLNGALTLWIAYVENGLIYSGVNPQGDKIHVSSMIEKHVPIYNLKITTYTKDNPKVPSKIALKKPFNHWFSKDGFFVALPFQQMLASNVPLIGIADPSKATDDKKAEKKMESAESLSEKMNEKWSALLAESSGVSVDQVPGNKTKDEMRKTKKT